MKRLYIFAAAALMPVCGAFAQEETTEQKQPDIQTMVGFSIIPNTTWKSGQFVSYKDYLNMDFYQTAFTTFEGSIWHNKTGLKLGVSADFDDNMVGKLNKFMGLVGYKKFVLRVQNSKLKGTANWTGTPTAGQPASILFNNKYTSIDLLYWKNPKKPLSMYFGLGYTAFSMPVQLNAEVYNTTTKQVVYAKAVYQDQMDYKVYTAMFGFDTMTSAIMGDAKGFGFWAYSQDKIGFGNMEISAEGKRRIEAANAANYPGRTLKTTSLTAAPIDYDATFGMFWKGNIKRASVALGLGYNISGMVVFAFGGGVFKDADHISPDPFPYLMRTGPVMKAVVLWG